MTPLLELGGAVVAVGGLTYLVRAAVIPYRTCGWCRGSGKNPFSGKNRTGLCWFCHGKPRRMTRGARMVRGLKKGDKDG